MRSANETSPVGAVPALPLASGELDAADARELEMLRELLEQRFGFFGAGYKEKCFRRRLAVRMRARGVQRYAEYAAVLREDPQEYERFLAAVMINVSKFFRNPEVWEAIREHVVPALFELDVPVVRIWSAGCAAGEEPYSLAMLLLEHAEAHGRMTRLQRFRIRATDIDREALEAARRAEYGDLAVGEVPERVRERWFEPGRPYRPRAEVKRLVRFEEADVITDRPAWPQHLIICRNVIIYFERALQESLFERFYEALAPGGFLVLGKVETLCGPAARLFQPVANRERVYRRL